MRNTTILAITAATAIVVACSETLTPAGTALRGSGDFDPQFGAEPHLGNASPTINAYLAAVPDAVTGDRYDASGRIQFRIGRLYPPGPCRSELSLAVAEGMTPIGVCARIDNPGGAALVSGAIIVDWRTGRSRIVASLGGEGLVPPGPCRTLLIRGTVLVDDATARAMVADLRGIKQAPTPGARSSGDFAAIFAFQEVNELPAPEIMGVFGDASAAGSPGDLFSFQEVNERCIVDVTAIPR